MTSPRRARMCQMTHRLIASRYPTVGVFDDLTSSPADLRVAFLLESITNDRLSLAASRLALLPDAEVVSGPGATLVMAAFLHADPAGGRFTCGRLGAWYAATDVDTAIAETLYHCDRRLRNAESAFPSVIQMRELVTTPDVDLVDLRGLRAERPDLYHPTDYRASQAFGIALRWPERGPSAAGIVYESVRRDGGTNICLYQPSLVPLPVVQVDHYEYRWDRAGEVCVFRLARIPISVDRRQA